MADDRAGDSAGKPMLEWVSAAVGLVLTLAMLGFLGWKAFTGDREIPPAITVDTGEITPVGRGYVVEIVARNHSGATAARVEVEGRILQGGRSLATSTVTFDYVPGHSSRHGGMFFERDPRKGELQARALGYSEP